VFNHAVSKYKSLPEVTWQWPGIGMATSRINQLVLRLKNFFGERYEKLA
jgi:hypothetical protein